LNFDQFVLDHQRRVDQQLAHCLPKHDSAPCYLHQAMHYAVFNGGKRLRPLLVYATGQLLGIRIELLDLLACMVELVHCYSLVHDDLPAMDDDDFRRGQPSCHRKFNEATALLAGNSLLTRAIGIVTESPITDLSAQTRLNIIQTLLFALESDGLVGGQALEFDPNFCIKNIDDIEKIHIHKTAILIQTAILLPAISMPTLPMQPKNKLAEFGSALGLAFQIQDDLLDWQSKQDCSKANHDCIPNYAAFRGETATKQRIHELYQQSLIALSDFDHNAVSLRALAQHLLTPTLPL